MREGYWINYRTGKVFSISDHMQWVSDDRNANKLGIPKSVAVLAKDIKDREKYLLFLMKNAPVMRVRGHGSFVTFEFDSRSRQDVMDAILDWGRQNAGPFTTMNITNFATKENTQIRFEEFENAMDSGGAEAVLRVAGCTSRVSVRASIIRELLAISKLLA